MVLAGDDGPYRPAGGTVDSGCRLDGPRQRARAGPLACLWAAWIFLALSALGSLSGEWLVGGIEAKVVAYGLLFSAIAAAIEGQAAGNGRRIFWAGVLAGLAISFHPVVGIWGVASALFATLVRTVFRGSRPPSRRLGGRWYAASAAALGLLSLPGIVAGLRAASGSSVVADYIQVYYRLAHHLDPLHFAEWGWIGEGLNWLLALSSTCRRSTSPAGPGSRTACWPVCGSWAGGGCRGVNRSAGSSGSSWEAV